MRGYRDDLDAARRRIDYLEEQLAERARPRRASPTKTRRKRRRGPPRRFVKKYVLVVGAIAPLALFALHRPAAVVLEHVAVPSVVDESASTPAVAQNHPLMTRLGDRDCGSRRYHALQQLPPESHLLDFEQCAGCACCLTPDKDRRECKECSKQHALTRAGIVTAGVRENKTHDGLRAIEKHIRITLPHPVTLFAATSRPTYLSSQGQSAAITMTARDANGRIVDTFETTHPTDLSARTPDGRKEAARSFLVVEACNGASIATVEFDFTEYSMVLANLAYYPP